MAIGDHRHRKSRFTTRLRDPEEGDIIEDLDGRTYMILEVEKKRILHWTTEVEIPPYAGAADWIEREN